MEQCEIIERCGELLSRGFSIQQVMETLDLYYSKKNNLTFQIILQSLFEGKTFYESLKNANFSSTICEFIYLSEKNGDLANGCKNAGITLRKLFEKGKQLRNKLIYPTVLFFFVFLLFLFIRMTIYPNFEMLQIQTSSSNNELLPILTMIPTILFYIFCIVIVVSFLLFICLQYFMKKKSQFKMWKVLIKIPLVKNGIQSYLTYYFSYQLYGLLNAGVSLQNCLTVFKEIQTKGWLKELAIYLEQQLLLGNDFSKSVAATKLFLPELEKSINLGNQNGKLVLELEHMSEFSFVKLEQLIQKVIVVIQPIMFTIIAVIIICLYLSILLPIFQMMEGM